MFVFKINIKKGVTIMKIMNISKIPCFKAQLSPEIKKGFFEMANNIDTETIEGKKTLKGMEKIVSFMPHVSISVKKYTFPYGEYYGYEMRNPKTNTTSIASNLETNKENLYKKRHIINIQYALIDEYIKEYRLSKSGGADILDSVHREIFG